MAFTGQLQLRISASGTVPEIKKELDSLLLVWEQNLKKLGFTTMAFLKAWPMWVKVMMGEITTMQLLCFLRRSKKEKRFKRFKSLSLRKSMESIKKLKLSLEVILEIFSYLQNIIIITIIVVCFDILSSRIYTVVIIL
jgi:hypothetical protein